MTRDNTLLVVLEIMGLFRRTYVQILSLIHHHEALLAVK